MNRADLRKRLARETGLSIEDPKHVEVLNDLINDAAEQIWEQTDLPRTLVEEIFTIDTTDPLPRVTLPARVGELRAVRDWWSKISLHDVRPKFAERPWPDSSGYTFRILGERPIVRSIDNAIGLYMAPLEDFTGPLTITVVGKVDGASEKHATFDANGEGTAVGVLWEDIYDIYKSHNTPIDINLLAGDATGEVMSTIGAYERNARFMEVELIELPRDGTAREWPVISRPLEWLYKPAFRPLYEDTSTFQVRGYNAAIIYKAVEIWRIRGIGDDATDAKINAAKVHAIRADEILANTINHKIQGQDLVLQRPAAKWQPYKFRRVRQRKYLE